MLLPHPSALPVSAPRSTATLHGFHRLTTEWTVGPVEERQQRPERVVPAEVPGAVQLDWARAEGWPPYWQGENSRAYGWMEDHYWVYATSLPPPTWARTERLFFVCGGVDYACEVRIHGVLVHAQEGMFTAFEIDCTTAAETGGTLEVVVLPAPKRQLIPADRAQASASVKPPVSYGWDWHPRLIPLGIWEETYFEVRPVAHLQDAELRYSLDEGAQVARLRVTARASQEAEGKIFAWRLLSPVGAVAAAGTAPVQAGGVSVHHDLIAPQLWWPQSLGAPALYQFEAELLDEQGGMLGRRSQRVGFRQVRLVMPAGAWEEPAQFPKSRSCPPVTVEVNGRCLFAKGSNWVNPEIFPGRCDRETYRPLLRLAQQAHFNLLRCWGGAPVAKEAFFELCNELGILVWQEFPLACNLYPDTAAYLDVLDRESQSIIRRLRRHPSLALWCGGNELFNAWSGMTDQSLPLRLLNRNCYDLDPGTPFLPTAPVEGMGHGGYQFRDDQGQEVFQLYAASRATAYSEFGCPGPSSVDYLQAFIPREELWPPRPGASWEHHHAFHAWRPDTWLGWEVQRHYFGVPATLEEMVARGQWLQCTGYQCVFEEARRQQPRCAMALNWCFNEPWPTAANNSLVNWPHHPKPAYFAVQAACRPVLASARIPRFSWRRGETFRATLWLLQDAPGAVTSGIMTATLVCGQSRRRLVTWEFVCDSTRSNVEGPEVCGVLPDTSEDTFELVLEVADCPDYASSYRLHLRAAVEGASPGPRTGARPLNA